MTTTLYAFDASTGEDTKQAMPPTTVAGELTVMSYTTPTPPPTPGAGEVAVYLDASGQPPAWWKDGSWQLLPDHRDTVYWLADGSKHTIDKIGDVLPAGALDAAPVIPPTEAQLEADAGSAVTKMLDELAQSWQYSSYQSARTYKGDVSAKYNAEGTAIANYGSACFAYLDGIKAGTNPRPADIAALLAALPTAPVRPS